MPDTPPDEIAVIPSARHWSLSNTYILYVERRGDLWSMVRADMISSSMGARVRLDSITVPQLNTQRVLRGDHRGLLPGWPQLFCDSIQQYLQADREV